MDVTLAILAGGEGSRMGRPKGLLRVRGLPILNWMLDQLRWPGPTLLVTAPGREHPPGWQRFDREATDPIAGLGPLRGVITALESAPTDRVIIAPVDMPFMSYEHFIWLSQQELDAGLMLRRPRDGNVIIEPMPLIVRTTALSTLRENLKTGRSSIRALAAMEGFSALDAPASWGDRVWTNLNSPGDLLGEQDFLPDDL